MPPGSRRAPGIFNPNAPSQTAAKVKEEPKNPEDEVISVETNLVTTPVSVLDRNGRFIAGLKQKDFKIFENGIPQKISWFQSEEQPFTVILMIDTSPSTRYRIDDIHFAAMTFVDQLRPKDQVMVVAFDQRTRVLTEPTSDRHELYSAIYRSQFGSGTSLYDAVDNIVSLDMLKIPGRKAVVLFTDGVDTTSRRADYDSTVAKIDEIDALFYPIRYDTQSWRGGGGGYQIIGSIPPDILAQLPPDVLARLGVGRGRGESSAEYQEGKRYLETLATNSGGRIFEADEVTNLDAAFKGVAEELRRQYSVGYYPADTGTPGERRQIKIQVARPRVAVRAKTSYVVKQDRNTTGTSTAILDK
jgi:VWFA-related protein